PPRKSSPFPCAPCGAGARVRGTRLAEPLPLVAPKKNGRSRRTGHRDFIFSFAGLLCAFIHRSDLVQRRQQALRARRHWHSLVEDDSCRAYFFSVEVLVGSVVRTKRGTF